jgi:CelD/BcsL family acetyltransferase involved in cellulose biosynthesis
LWLSEVGETRYDDVFIEHNGLLIERSQPRALLAACLCAARTAPIVGLQTRGHRTVTLSGVPEDYILAGRHSRRLEICVSRPAPFVDLQAIRDRHPEFLASTSANTRYQIRRAERQYMALGPLAVRRAGSVDEAHDFLTHLAALHQIYWTGRGRAGSFANPHFQRFHRALIDRGFAMGAIDLLKITAGPTILGYLYNLSFRGQVYAYQSGFDYRLPVQHHKPGLTCHHLAIEKYIAEGYKSYDFLGGADQYQMSLANAMTKLLHSMKMGEARPSAILVNGVRMITKRMVKFGRGRAYRNSRVLPFGAKSKSR